MKIIKLTESDICKGSLILVNAENSYVNNDSNYILVPVNYKYPDIVMNNTAVNFLHTLLVKISAGDSIVPVSGYRSFAEQTAIYNDSLNDNGEVFTKKYVALPDHSEHQTGLAIDLALNRDDIDFICPDFPYNGICDDFRNTAPDYGFVQRYTKDKEKVTGISNEPWHFRYVGYPHSKIMIQLGLCLEEYIEYIKCYDKKHRLRYRFSESIRIEIFYVPSNGCETVIEMPENSVYQLSGNNMDGFIITIWR